ncbi:hypothetical protein BJX66DRAFT_308112 [Aspergillus keveii]|uniref:Uncharacterized protein n=1 Tax=Aspergillus keveii TaxID=714993 RepID=A0ABR4G005_9EURO
MTTSSKQKLYQLLRVRIQPSMTEFRQTDIRSMLAKSLLSRNKTSLHADNWRQHFSHVSPSESRQLKSILTIPKCNSNTASFSQISGLNQNFCTELIFPVDYDVSRLWKPDERFLPTCGVHSVVRRCVRPYGLISMTKASPQSKLNWAAYTHPVFMAHDCDALPSC